MKKRYPDKTYSGYYNAAVGKSYASKIRSLSIYNGKAGSFTVITSSSRNGYSASSRMTSTLKNMNKSGFNLSDVKARTTARNAFKNSFPRAGLNHNASLSVAFERMARHIYPLGPATHFLPESKIMEIISRSIRHKTVMRFDKGGRTVAIQAGILYLPRHNYKTVMTWSLHRNRYVRKSFNTWNKGMTTQFYVLYKMY